MRLDINTCFYTSTPSEVKERLEREVLFPSLNIINKGSTFLYYIKRYLLMCFFCCQQEEDSKLYCSVILVVY